MRTAGTLGVAVDDASDAGFDIAANGSAFASLTVGGQSGLYRVNLVSGAATPIGALPVEVRSHDDHRAGQLSPRGGRRPGRPGRRRQGDAVRRDIDGDGVSNTAEQARGTNPRKADSDGDGVADGADACPTTKGSAPSGCDKRAPKITFRKTPKKLTFKRFFDGVTTRISVGEAARLDVSLLIGLSSASAAKAGDLVLAEKHLKRSAQDPHREAEAEALAVRAHLPADHRPPARDGHRRLRQPPDEDEEDPGRG